MDKKVIFLDIDGTLVNRQGRLPDSAAFAVRAARRNGHRVILATGRQKSQIYPWLLQEIGFDGIIASCGAYIESADGKVLFASRPTEERLRFIVNFFRSRKTPYCLQTAETIVTEDWCLEPIIRLFRDYGHGQKVIDSVFADTVITDRPEARTDVEKVSYYCADIDRDQVQAALGDYFFVTGYSLGNGHDTSRFGEVTFEGVNKAVGIQKYIDSVGASREDTVAIGDSGNDREMIVCAGIGVAMGNADAALKDAADMVTSDIDSDGILQAFRRLSLI